MIGEFLVYIFWICKNFLRKKVAIFFDFYQIPQKWKNFRFMGGLVFFKIFVYTCRGVKEVRVLFVNLLFLFTYPSIYGYLRAWYYLCNIYGISPPTYTLRYGHSMGYPYSEYP